MFNLGVAFLKSVSILESELSCIFIHMRHDLHYLINTNQSTQDDTLPATVVSDIPVEDMLS